jgi:hypothetical protein
MNGKKRKTVPQDEQEEKETETMDIYKDKELEEMLEEDEITESEYNFMLGREKVRKKSKLGLERKEHQDTHAGELAKTEYEDD